MNGHDAVILAAGGSVRLGRPKQLLTVGGETLVARTVRLVLATFPARTVVVLGAYPEAISAAIPPGAAEIAVNAAWHTGMASSLQVAAARLAGRDRPVLVTVIDQPALDAACFEALLAAHDGACDTVSAYGDTLGVPAVLRPSTLAQASGLRGDQGFRRLWNAMSPHRVRADMLAHDLDTNDDVAHAVACGWIDPPH